MAAPFDPATPAPEKLGAADPIQRWGELTLQGNLAFEQGEEFTARQAYSEALAAAEELLAAARANDVRAGIYAPALFGIACNNIIALARRQDDGLTAGIFQCKLAEEFLSVMESDDAPLALRSRCLLHSRIASASLCRYFEERGMWDATETYTARANAAFFAVQRLESSAAARSQVTIERAGVSLPDDEVVLVLPDELALPDEVLRPDDVGSAVVEEALRPREIFSSSGDALPSEAALGALLSADAVPGDGVSLLDGDAIDSSLDNLLVDAGLTPDAEASGALVPRADEGSLAPSSVSDALAAVAADGAWAASGEGAVPSSAESAVIADTGAVVSIGGAVVSADAGAVVSADAAVASSSAAPSGDGADSAFGVDPTFDPDAAFGADAGFGAHAGFGEEPAFGEVPAFGAVPGFGAVPAFAAVPSYEATLEDDARPRDGSPSIPPLVSQSALLSIAPPQFQDTELSQDALVSPRPLISNEALLSPPSLFDEEPPRPSMPAPPPLEPPKTARGRLFQWLGRTFSRRPGRDTMTSLGDIARAK